MRVYKILSFSVVILLIAVLFAGAVTVPAAAQTTRQSTKLTIQAVKLGGGRDWMLYGTLSVVETGKPIQGGSVRLQVYDPAVNHWRSYGGVLTNSTGGYALKVGVARLETLRVRASFDGSDVYKESVSPEVVVWGSTSAPTEITLQVSNTTPVVNQQVTFTATLKSSTTPLSGKCVTIYHYLNSVKYTDKTIYTDSSGKVTLTQTFGSAGQRTYYATFAGDSSYQTSTSSVIKINVNFAQTRVTLIASTTTPAVNQKVTFTAKLYWWNSATNQWEPVSGKPVTIYHYLNGVKYTDTTKNTDSSGKVTLTQSFSTKGQRTYYATFAGDTSYKGSTSAVVTIRVH